MIITDRPLPVPGTNKLSAGTNKMDYPLNELDVMSNYSIAQRTPEIKSLQATVRQVH